MILQSRIQLRYLLPSSESAGRNSEFDLKSGSCTASIWYDKHDETELLIMLLGFGPVLKVTAPEDFLKKFRERINQQYELFFKDIKDM